jgi:hypothetical protein
VQLKKKDAARIDSERELVLGDLRKLESAVSSAVKELRAVEEEQQAAHSRLARTHKVPLPRAPPVTVLS